ncbi:MAG: hypothetical protein ACREMZ_08285 [Gemmatimonadales bacterium]
MAPGSSSPASAAPLGTGSLLVALLGAPIAWAVHLALSYFLVALDCGTSWNGGRNGIVVATIGFALAAAGSGLFGWREWKRMRVPTRRGDVNQPQSREFFLLGGVVLAMLFTVAIVLAGVSPFLLPMCS